MADTNEPRAIVEPWPEFERIHVELGRADGAVVLRIQRPEARNAIDRATMGELEAALDRLEAMPEMRALVLAADGEKTFVAGGDLKDFSSLDTPELGQAMGRRMGAVLRRIADLECPSIAAIAGNAYGGGCEIAVACDFRVMAHGSNLVFSQGRLGLITGWGGTPRLTRLVGPSLALRILATGAYVSAEQAERMGLAESAPEGMALAHALDLARQIARISPESVKAFKRLVWASTEMDFDAACTFENELFGTRWASEEHRRAVSEFLHRRPPAFEDRGRDVASEPDGD